jgi:hypothetical protein
MVLLRSSMMFSKIFTIRNVMQKQKTKPRVFYENPYDLETLFESLSIASEHDKELIFVDRLISLLRLDPEVDLTTLNFKILKDLNLVTLEMTN